MSQPEESRSKTAETDAILMRPGGDPYRRTAQVAPRDEGDQGEARVDTATSIRQVMSAEPVTVPPDSTLPDVARQMRSAGIGAVIVQDGHRVHGIVTDRDIVVRALAEQADPGAVTAGDICSGDLVTVRPDDDIGQAVLLMREHAVRRLPVTDDGRVVGVVSLGDLALDRDRHSALAQISAAEPNT